MLTAESSRTLAHLFAELVDGVTSSRGGFMLNTGDAGMLASLDKLSAEDASHSTNGGATIYLGAIRQIAKSVRGPACRATSRRGPRAGHEQCRTPRLHWLAPQGFQAARARLRHSIPTTPCHAGRH